MSYSLLGVVISDLLQGEFSLCSHYILVYQRQRKLFFYHFPIWSYDKISHVVMAIMDT
jgi:hypothetical protein